MNKDEIVKYVMNTPGNTNEQILRLALDGLESGGGSVYPEVTIKFTTIGISPVEVPGRSIIVITDPGKVIYAFLVTRESFILPANGEVNCITDLIYLSPDPINITGLVVDVSFIADLSQTFQAINGAINVAPDTYFLYDKTEISILLSSK